MSVPDKRFAVSFLNAIRGVAFLFQTQRNARIELVIACIAVAAGFLLNISMAEWIVVLLCIALVLGLEGINTALEIFANKFHPDFNIEIRNTKDVAAGAVLVAAIISAIIGFIIFVPRVIIFL